MPLSVIVVTGCRPSAMLWDAEVPTWAPEHHPPRQCLVCNWYRFQAFCKWKALYRSVADNGLVRLGQVPHQDWKGKILLRVQRASVYRTISIQVNPSFRRYHLLKTSFKKKFQSTSLEISHVPFKIIIGYQLIINRRLLEILFFYIEFIKCVVDSIPNRAHNWQLIVQWNR